MKGKIFPLLLLLLCILLIMQGCTTINAGGEKMGEHIHTIADFTNVKIGMTYDEVVKLVGEPTSSIGSGIVWQRYKLDDGWYINLLFLGDAEKLTDMRIVDYPNTREFVLKQD